MIIKERLGTSDEETVEQMRENPYLQYFLGYKQYRDDNPFDPSLFVYFRKRFGKKKLAKINEVIARKALEEEKRLKNIGQYSVTQNDFVDFLKNGRLKVDFDYLLDLIRGKNPEDNYKV